MVATVVALVAVGVIAAGAVSAARADDEPRSRALVGTWDVTLQLPGAPPARVLVNASVRVASDGESFEAVSISELRDPAGALIVGGLRGTATATRVYVETIEDRP